MGVYKYSISTKYSEAKRMHVFDTKETNSQLWAGTYILVYIQLAAINITAIVTSNLAITYAYIRRSSLHGCTTYSSHEDASCTKTSQPTPKNELSILYIICWMLVTQELHVTKVG